MAGKSPAQRKGKKGQGLYSPQNLVSRQEGQSLQQIREKTAIPFSTLPQPMKQHKASERAGVLSHCTVDVDEGGDDTEATGASLWWQQRAG